MRVLLLAMLLAGAVGCQTPGAARRAAVQDVCTNLGRFSYVIASYKVRGDSRGDQIRWANADIADGAARHAALRIIHFVYVADRDPVELGVETARRCEPQEDGSARVVLEHRG